MDANTRYQLLKIDYDKKEAEIAELRDALYDCYNQFAFDDGSPTPEEQMLSNGGHGTLERIEDILGFSSPIKRVELWHLQGEEYK